jgi:hypothetical protein
MSTQIQWPAPPAIDNNDPQAEIKKMLYQAQLDVIKAKFEAGLAVEKAKLDATTEDAKRESTTNIDREKAEWANEYAQAQAVNSAYLEAAKSSLDRSVARATFVQGAAAAVSGAYVGVLGFTFTVTQNKLPPRGIIPTVFLGVAIFLAAVYVSFVTKPEDVPVKPSDGSLFDIQRQRRNSFVSWISAPILRRRQYLQASVISLGIGALLLPLPFVNISDTLAVVLAIAGLLSVWYFSSKISQWKENGVRREDLKAVKK